jgi:hypothetical protein
MPYLPYEDELNKQQGTGGVAEGMAVNQDQGVIGGGGVAPKQKQGSGQYVNLQSYIQANQPQTERMTGNIIGNLGQREKGIQSGITNFGQQYAGQIGGLTQEEKNRQGLIENISTNPTAYMGQASDINKQLKGIYGRGGYTGATNLSAYNPSQYAELAGKAGEYKSDIDKTATIQGRLKALKDIQQQGITGGQDTLNALFLQQTPTASAEFEKYRTNAANLPENLQAKQAESQQLGQEYLNQRSMSENALRGLYGQYSGLESTTEQARQARLNEMNAGLAAQRAKLKEYSSQLERKPIEETYTNPGGPRKGYYQKPRTEIITNQSSKNPIGNVIRPIVRGDYGIGDVTEQSVISPEEMNRLSALRNILQGINY